MLKLSCRWRSMIRQSTSPASLTEPLICVIVDPIGRYKRSGLEFDGLVIAAQVARVTTTLRAPVSAAFENTS